MPVKSVEIDISVRGDADSKARLDAISARAEELKKTFPEFTAKIDTAAASEKLKVFRAQLDVAAKDKTVNVKVKVDQSELAKLGKSMQSGGPGLLLSSAVLALPAIATMAGVAAGAVATLSAGFVAGAGALAGFGAVAKPVLTDAKTAATAVETAQSNYNAAIAAGTPHAAAYKTEQIAIARAYADMSPAQVTLSKQIGDMASAWDKVKAAQTPVVAGALQPWLKSVTDLTKNLGPVIAGISPVIGGLGVQFDALINSPAFTKFRDFVAGTGSAVVSAGGSALINFIKGLMLLLPQFEPLIREAALHIADFGASFARWAGSKAAADDIQKFMRWFSTNGPAVGEVLKSVGRAIAGLAPGMAAGGMSELKIISDFLTWIARLPKGISGPIAEVAGALLVLNKIGVVKIALSGLDKAIEGIGALTKAMWGFDLAANANTIGLVVVAIAALGAAFWVAWQKSAGFRDFMKGFAAGLLEGGIIIVQAAKIIVDAVLNMYGTIVHGAATAFGWIPGLGGKLKGAATAFDSFKAGVDKNMQGAIDKMKDWQAQLMASQKTAAVTLDAITSHFKGTSAAAVQGRTDLMNYGNAVLDTGNKSTQTAGARAALIADLVKSGMKASDAATLVDSLGTSITKLPANTALAILMAGTGTYTIKNVGASVPGGLAAGGYITAGTGPVADDVPVLVSRGELIVPAHMVSSGAVDHLRGRIPGFASGGVITSGNLTPAYITGMYADFKTTFTNAMVAAMQAAMKAAVAAATAAAAKAGAVSAAGLTNSSGYAALKAAAESVGWTGAQWQALVNVEMREAGFSLTAQNPSSGAYGMAQFINGPGEYAQYGGNATTYSGQAAAMVNYILQRYGTPAAAWAHEQQYGWYDRGGLLRPGLTLAYNGTGRPEMVLPSGRPSGGDGGSVIAELRALRAAVADLTGVAAAIPARTGHHVTAGLGGAAADAAFRARYPARGW
jgi:hypothetical protein